MSSDSRSRRRGVWTHWVPLVATVTIATVGLAAWAWSQRNEDDEEEEHAANAADFDYNTADYGDNPAYGANREKAAAGARAATRDGNPTYGVTEAHAESAAVATGWGAQMSGALRRTPSPQQFLSNASRTVAAGMAGVGAAVGSALASIREDDKNAYADHETWSEEVENQKTKSSTSKDPSKRRKTVAIIVSADANLDDLDTDGFHEHASVLSHIPTNTDFTKIKLFVLIYSPSLKENELSGPAGTLPPPSLSSSFSNIGADQVKTPASEGKSPLLSSTNVDPSFNAVYAQALALVEKESMVLPFTTANGYTHILRHLQPSVVYLQESLSGPDGGLITQLQTWLRHDVILVVGADGGHGGLADSESEAERPEKKKKEVWWHREDRVGRGRGVVVVDSLRVGDDWARRVQGKE
ncbi:uncharacterized protein B0I36DRAFT_309562 [Microdochium trichocladiopsis]|uniref:Peroxin 22-like protein n=1 Tax=Microdochium trichocladiopsis TaxID=1682393 RepID=A0A9P8YH49_9PEZI|nr:uncharacterized protein B0I36DRAFT_309562 [Microdochium trichocladiopsis]KAH7039893.1 hypothetical protein B0I36DRAFT_309562 [Microdochium trichocladiopsis]